MSKKLTLTDYERVSLINQFSILNQMDQTNIYNKEDYNAMIDILVEGNEGLYDEIFEILEKTVNPEIAKEVRDILHLHDMALIAYEKLSTDEQSEDLKYKISFKGFDGQAEHEHKKTLELIVKKIGDFKTLFLEKDSQFDSHSKELSKYREQLKKSEKEIENPLYTKEQLERIFS